MRLHGWQHAIQVVAALVVHRPRHPRRATHLHDLRDGACGSSNIVYTRNVVEYGQRFVNVKTLNFKSQNINSTKRRTAHVFRLVGYVTHSSVKQNFTEHHSKNLTQSLYTLFEMTIHIATLNLNHSSKVRNSRNMHAKCLSSCASKHLPVNLL